MYNLWHSQVPIGATTAFVFRPPASGQPAHNPHPGLVYLHRFRFSFYGFIKLGKTKTLEHIHSLLKHRDHNRTINGVQADGAGRRGC